MLLNSRFGAVAAVSHAVAFFSAHLLGVNAKSDPAPKLYLVPGSSFLNGLDISWAQTTSLLAHQADVASAIPHDVLSSQADVNQFNRLADVSNPFVAKPKSLFIVVQGFDSALVPAYKNLASLSSLLNTPSHSVKNIFVDEADKNSDVFEILGAQLADSVANAKGLKSALIIATQDTLDRSRSASKVALLEDSLEPTGSTKTNIKGFDMQLLGTSEILSAWMKDLGLTTSLSLTKPVDTNFMMEAFSLSQLKVENLPKFTFVRLAGLREMAKEYGTNSVQYQSAIEVMTQVLHRTLAKIDASNDGSKAVTASLITVPYTLQVRTRSAHLARRAATSAATCYTSAAACNSANSGCNSHGTCVASNSTGTTCYSCVCSTRWTDDSGNEVKGFSGHVKWTGAACQYQNIATPFHLLFWTTVALLVTLIFTISLLFKMDGASSTGGSGFASGRTKAD